MSKAKNADASARPLSRQLIENMLTERQQMLVLMWELSKLDCATVDQTLFDTLAEFQEILVDYIASGHFGLYQRLVEGTERRQTVLDTASGIYPRIEQSTDIAVEFTERYDTAEAPVIQTKLTADLSQLAEQLTTRIELEDSLILAMLGDNFAIPEVRPGA